MIFLDNVQQKLPIFVWLSFRVPFCRMPERIHVPTVWYIYQHVVDFWVIDGFHAGKYTTNCIDPMRTGKKQHIHLTHLVKSSSPCHVSMLWTQIPVTGGYITSMATTLTTCREDKSWICFTLLQVVLEWIWGAKNTEPHGVFRLENYIILRTFAWQTSSGNNSVIPFAFRFWLLERKWCLLQPDGTFSWVT